MATKKQAKQATIGTSNKGIKTESASKKLSAVGKWLNDPNAKPWIKIIDMKAVLK
jgi:hypothetical protein